MSWTDTKTVDYDRHVRRSAVCDTIEEAFAFCLTGIEEEGLCAPVVEVSPTMMYDEALSTGRMVFEASVSGHSHADDEDDDQSDDTDG